MYSDTSTQWRDQHGNPPKPKPPTTNDLILKELQTVNRNLNYIISQLHYIDQKLQKGES